jgi:hypothetical protein
VEHRKYPKDLKLSKSTDNDWEALSDGTISSLIHPFSGGNAFYEFF